MRQRTQGKGVCRERIQLPDEIVAEQKFKRDHTASFEARARDYVEMQREHEKEIETPQSDDPLGE